MVVFNVLVMSFFQNKLASSFVRPFLSKKTAESYVKFIFNHEGYSTDFKHVSILQPDMLKVDTYNYSTVEDNIKMSDTIVSLYNGYRSEIKGIHTQLTVSLQESEIRDTLS